MPILVRALALFEDFSASSAVPVAQDAVSDWIWLRNFCPSYFLGAYTRCGQVSHVTSVRVRWDQCYSSKPPVRSMQIDPTCVSALQKSCTRLREAITIHYTTTTDWLPNRQAIRPSWPTLMQPLSLLAVHDQASKTYIDVQSW